MNCNTRFPFRGYLLNFFLFGWLFFTTATAVAGDSTGIKLSYIREILNDSELVVTIRADIPKGIKLYASKKPGNDILYTSIEFDSIPHRKLLDRLQEQGNKQTEIEYAVNDTVTYFTDSVRWRQRFELKAGDSATLKAQVNLMYKNGDSFIPEEKVLNIPVKSANATTGPGVNKNLETESLLWLFLAAFGGGLLALLTPCVYSMIPVTVSFFIKRSKTKAAGVRNALYYAISIVVIFTVLGFFITLIFGPAALNNLATNWIANLIFFGLFLVFGFSFLGAFEITLPAGWTNTSGSKANANSFIGIFFMALTLVIVSFSCTGPIIGNLLVLASKGNYFGPLVGMLGFSTALALPFALFAFFPSKLTFLAKAGGWLNAIKVTLGLLELALALKFLSNADLVKGWRILDREVFLSFWIVICSLLGLYLLGKVKFRHDDELPKNDFSIPYLSVTRLVFAIVAFSFTVYMIPGLWGAPLKSISAFLPPMGTQDFVIGGSTPASYPANTSLDQQDLHPQKYYEKMKMYEPEVVTKYGITTYFDYDEALAAARKLKKPLMLDFTGINCVNCRKMEGQVWSDPQVLKLLKEDFVIVSLYVDVQNVQLPEQEQYTSAALDKRIETLGDKNADFQVTKFGANSQPYYFFIDANENKLIPQGYGYDPDITKFINLLHKVKANYSYSSSH